MKHLYLACYFNEMESENDADVIVIDDVDNPRDAFKIFFKETHDYEIKDGHIINLYQITDVFDRYDSKYQLSLKEIS